MPGSSQLQPGTILQHVLLAMLHGRNVDLQRLQRNFKGTENTAPTRAQAACISSALRELRVDVMCGGKTSSAAIVKDVLRVIVCDAKERDTHDVVAALDVDAPYRQKSQEYRDVEQTWNSRINWWLALRRVGAVSESNGQSPRSVKRRRVDNIERDK
jgi:hypothetical protein